MANINNTSSNVSVNGSADSDRISVSGSAVTVNGGTGNDTIYGIGSASAGRVYQYAAGDGADVIYGFSSNDVLRILADSYTTEVSGADLIVRVGSGSVTIKDGADMFVNIRTMLVNGTSAAEKIVNEAHDMIINGNGGNDSITNSGYRTSITAGAGNDSIVNSGQYVTINAGDGANKISNSGYNSRVTTGSGNDSIYNSDGYTTINSGAGNDTINNYGYSTSINAGAGNDSIYSPNNSVTINAGDGDDTIYAYSGSINGGAGNDSISISGNSSGTVIGGTGDDTINASGNYGRLYQYANGDGNDLITGFSPNDTLHITNGTYTTLKSGNDVILTIGSGSVTLKNALANFYDRVRIKNADGSFVTLGGGIRTGTAGNDTLNNVTHNENFSTFEGNDRITNSGRYVTMNTGEGNDTINNTGNYSSMNGGTGTDSIYNNGQYSTIYGGADNDTIYNDGYNSKIDGGAGNDSIYNSSSYVTIDGGDGDDTINVAYNYSGSISGGAGNDRISLYSGSSSGNTVSGGTGDDTVSLTGDSSYSRGRVYQYASGDGNDVVYGFSPNDTLAITSGEYSTSVSGSDFIVTVGRSAITLKGAAGTYGKVRIQEPNGRTTIYNNWSVMEGTSKADSLTNNADNVEVIGDAGNDRIMNAGIYVTIRGGDGADTIQNRAGGDYSYVDGGAGNDSIYHNDGDGVEVHGGTDNDTINGNYYSSRIYGEDGNDRISVGGGSSNTIDGGAGDDTIQAYSGSINGGDGNDSISLGSTTSNSTIIGGKGNDIIRSSGTYGRLYRYSIGDGYDTIYGFSVNDSIHIAAEKYNTYNNGNDVVVSVQGGSITLKDAKDKVSNVRSILKQGTTANDTMVNAESNFVVDSGDGNDTITNSGNYTTVQGGTGNDSIKNSGQYAVVDGGDGADTIYNSGYNSTIIGGGGNDSIYSNNYVVVDGGDGDDTIYGYGSINGGAGDDRISVNSSSTVDGGAGNDTIYGYGSINGGDGNDLISLTGGNSTVIGGKGDDTIRTNGGGNLYKYAEGDGNDLIDSFNANDTLQITKGAFETLVSGNDVIVTVGDGSITLKGALKDPYDRITFVDENGDRIIINDWNIMSGTSKGDSLYNVADYVTVSGLAGNDTITNIGNGVVITGDEDNDRINNSGQYTKIYGGDGADTINNSGERASISGGAGNDSIYSGGQYSTINAGDGSDTVQVYGWQSYVDGGAGNDSIYNGNGYSTIYGGDGDDSIYAYNYQGLVSGGNGNDKISLSSASDGNTVIGGAGNDTVSLGGGNYGILYVYNNGDGNDLIQGIRAKDTLQINGAEYSTTKSGSDLIVKVGSGAVTFKGGANVAFTIDGQPYAETGIDTLIGDVITLSAGNDTYNNSASNKKILALAGADTVKNSANFVTIDAGAGNDVISNTAVSESDFVSISGGAGDDKLFNDYGYNVTLAGGDGNDTLTNTRGRYISLSGGAGADLIKTSNATISGKTYYSELVTINGGLGNDTISLGSYDNLIQYANGDGNDIIYGFGGWDSLSIGGGKYLASTLGKDVIVTVGSGRVTLKNAAGEDINLIGEQDTVGLNATISTSNTSLTATSNNDTIYFDADRVTVSTGAGDDLIYNNYTRSGGTHRNYGLLDAGDGNDTIRGCYVATTINSGAGNDLLAIDQLYYSGNNATIPVIDTGDGNDTIMNYSYGVHGAIKTGSGDDFVSITAYGKRTTIDGGEGNDTLYVTTAYVSGENTSIVAAGGAGNDVISLSGNMNSHIINGGTGDDTLYGEGKIVYQYANGDGNDVVYGFASNDTLRITSGSVSGSSVNGNDVILTIGEGSITLKDAAGTKINYVENGKSKSTVVNSLNIVGTSGADKINNTLDNATITALAGNDTITNSGDSVVYIYNKGDGNDLIQNLGENATLNIGGVVYSTSTVGNDVVVKAGSGTITLQGAVNNPVEIVGEKDTVGMRATITTLHTVVSATDNKDTILVKAGDVFLSTGEGNDSIYVDTRSPYLYNNVYGYVTVDAGTGNDTIHIYDPRVSINGGAGDDLITLMSDWEKVTLTGGAGNDTFSVAGSGVLGRLFQYNSGDGNDIIYGYNSYDTLQISGGNYTTSTVGNNLVISVEGSGAITLVGAKSNTLNINPYIFTENADIAENTVSNAYLDALGGNDSIKNSGNSVIFKGGSGNDTIINSGDYNTYIYANGDGNDLIEVLGAHDTISITSGSVSNASLDGNDVVLKIGAGTITLKDQVGSAINYVENGKSKSTVLHNLNITGTDGDDIINNTLDNATITALAGNDTIINSGKNVFVNGGSGDDIINGSGTSVVYVYGKGDGNDTIGGFSASDTLKITSGSISGATVSGGDVVLTIGDGSITLKDKAEQTITYIENGKSKSTVIHDLNIFGTDGADNINNTLDNATITALAGNDTINNKGNSVVYVYDDGDGNDIINGFGKNDTLNITGGSISGASVNGNDVVLIIGDGTITLKDKAEQAFTYIEDGELQTTVIHDRNIIGTDGADNINNTLDNATIDARGGNDTITNKGDSVVYIYDDGDGNDIIRGFGENDTLNITSGSISGATVVGNDVVLTIGDGTITLKDKAEEEISYIENGELQTSIIHDLNIKGTNGADNINNTLDNATIDARGGNDTITNSGDNVFVNGGAGNDTIYNSGDSVTYQYGNGDGHDVISGFGENDTIQLTSGSVSNAYVEGNDIILTIGTGSITLKDTATDSSLAVVDQEGIRQEFTVRPALPNGWKYDNAAKTKVKATIAGAEDLDLTLGYGVGVTVADASKTNRGVYLVSNDSGNSIKGGQGADTVISGAGNDTVSLGAGNDVFVYTGGYDILMDYTANQDTVIFRNGIEIKNVQTVSSSLIFTTSAGTFDARSSKNKNLTVYDEDGNVLYPYTPPTLPSGWKYNSNKTSVTATVKTGAAELDMTKAYGNGVVTVDAVSLTSAIKIGANNTGMAVKAGSGANTIVSGSGNDTVSLGAGNDVFVYTGGNDTIYKYTQRQDVIQIDTDVVKISATATVGSVVNYTTNVGTLSIKDGKGKEIVFIDKDGNTIPDPNPGTDTGTLPAGWKLNAAKNGLQATVSTAGSLDLSKSYGEGIKSVDAIKVRGVSIVAGGTDVSIKTGSGNDTIVSSESNNTLTGGAGADVFVYTGGDNIITDYGTGNDLIQIRDTANISVQAVEVSGSNKVITTNVGVITLKGGKSKDVTIIDAANETIYPTTTAMPAGWQYNNNKKMMTATVAAPSSLDLNEDYGADVKIVDANKATVGITITGNDLSNSIKGGKGADTIIGGEGNDTVSLGAGNDVYIYTGGDDLIQDLAVGADSIRLDANAFAITSSESVGTNHVFTFNNGSGALTIKGGKGKNITLYDLDGNAIVPDIPTPPNGWKYGTKDTILSATITAPENLDLTESYGDNVVRVDATKTNKGVQIIGNDNGNSIKGGSGADTIIGGTGDDTVSMGGGADVYVYTGGNDLIQDYATVDAIKLNSAEFEISHVATVSTNVVFTLNDGDGAMTIKGGKGKTIMIYDSETGSQIYPEPTASLPAGWGYGDKANTFVKATLASAALLDLNESYGNGVVKVDASKISGGAVVKAHDEDISIKASGGADTIYGGSGNDTVSLGVGADVYIYSGGDDLIQDYATVDAIRFNDVNVGAAETVGSDVVFTTEEGKLTIKNGKNKSIEIFDMSGERIYPNVASLPNGWRYANTANTKVTATLATASSIDLTETYGEGVTTVDASKLTGGISITANDLGVSIKGGKGADTIIGGEGKDTLAGGAGADVFIYTGGDDVITDYAAVDVIQVAADFTFTSLETLKNDLVYTFNNGEGVLTVQGGKNKAVTIVDSNGDAIGPDDALPRGWAYNTSRNLVSATGTTAATLDLNKAYGENVTKVDASKLTGGVKITANDSGVSIKGGKGADTIVGGEKNDTLAGGTGADVFVYNGGDDTITDYTNADSIVFDTNLVDVQGVATVSTNVIYTTDQGTLTVKNGRGKTISIFDIDGGEVSFTASSADLFEDDNFIGSGAEIDSLTEITADNYSVTNIEAPNFENIAQDNKYTFAYGKSENK